MFLHPLYLKFESFIVFKQRVHRVSNDMNLRFHCDVSPVHHLRFQISVFGLQQFYSWTTDKLAFALTELVFF